MKNVIVNSIVPPMEKSKSRLDVRMLEKRDDSLFPSFHPEINNRSKKLKRGGSVETILYLDA